MQTFTVLFGLVATAIVWYGSLLLANYRLARKSGFPVLLMPVDKSNIFWMIFSVPLRPVFMRILPTFAYEWLRPSIYGWEFRYRWQVQESVGPSFILAYPKQNELWTAEPEVCLAVLSRRKDFLQTDVSSVFLGFFGQNLLTSNGDDWQRQRRIIAPLLNERISSLVWRESSEQAREMLEFFMAGPAGDKSRSGETDGTIEGLRTIAINVLGSAGYGTPQSWKQESVTPPPGHRLTYMDAVAEVVNNLVSVALVSPKVLCAPFMSEGIRRIGYAVTEFPSHIEKLLEKERSIAGPTRNNLMSVLVRLSDSEKSQETSMPTKASLYLSENEIRGNLFIFTVAGYETTANTMAYAITTLAMRPDLQDWIGEEIDQALQEHDPADYEKIFPALKRCLAIMYETLRLFTPVAHVIRSSPYPQTITTRKCSYHIPAHTEIYVTTSCLHINPDVWGADALDFKPERWLTADGEAFVKPQPGSFMPWSAGPRHCPGTKMAQVEFVAVVMAIFSNFRVAPAVGSGETLREAQDRLGELMADSQPRITLQMNRPRDVRLRWTRR